METVYTDHMIAELVAHFTKILMRKNIAITKIALTIADTKTFDDTDLESLRTAGKIQTSAERALLILDRVMSVPVDDRFKTLTKNISTELCTDHLQDLLNP